MMSGFDRYFQIAPCFRDEDARADRSPGEFYQLDLEMSFVTQQDVFDAVEPVMRGVFEEFSGGKPVTQKFPLIPYAEAMLKYGTDKPDLRNPIGASPDVERKSSMRRASPSMLQAGDRGRRRGARHSGAETRRRSRARSSTSSANGREPTWARPAWATSCSRPKAMRSSARGRSRKIHPRRRQAKIVAKAGIGGGRRGVLCRRQAGRRRQARGCRAHQDRRRARPDRQGSFRVLLDRRFPDV